MFSIHFKYTHNKAWPKNRFPACRTLWICRVDHESVLKIVILHSGDPPVLDNGGMPKVRCLTSSSWPCEHVGGNYLPNGRAYADLGPSEEDLPCSKLEFLQKVRVDLRTHSEVGPSLHFSRIGPKTCDRVVQLMHEEYAQDQRRRRKRTMTSGISENIKFDIGPYCPKTEHVRFHLWVRGGKS